MTYIAQPFHFVTCVLFGVLSLVITFPWVVPSKTVNLELGEIFP